MIQKLKSVVQQRSLSRSVRRTIKSARKRNLTYLSEAKLTSLATLCRVHEEKNIPGVIIEAGCALGGSSIVLTEAKQIERKLRVYDVFGMIPPPSQKDGEDVHKRYETIESGQSRGIGGDTYYGYVEDLYQQVQSSFESLGYPPGANNVQLIKGLVQDTLEVTGPVCLAHIDVDWYEPVMTCLRRIEPMLSPGGSIVLDDYQDWSGCRRATDEYFADRRDGGYTFDQSSGAMVITKAMVN